jgi:DNA (cytosine-5)-methyltransferase 1
LVWSDENTDFVDLPSMDEVETLLKSLKPHRPCISCAVNLREENHKQLQCIPNGFTQYGLKYHVGDCIYIQPPENYGVLEVAQIVNIQGGPTDLLVSVCFFGRYDDSVPKQKYMEERLSFLDEVTRFFYIWAFDLNALYQCRLYLHIQTKEISSNQIDGLCYVNYLTDPDSIEEWVQHADHYYVNQKCDDEGLLVPMEQRFLKCCRPCYDEHIKKLQCAQRLKDKNQPLRGLELFSGECITSYVMLFEVL